MRSPRLIAAAAGAAILLASSIASAVTAEREVLGWTPAGEVVVHLVERGEHMVDGISKDYYVEATEVWSPSNRTARLYKHGDPVGTAPVRFTTALPENDAKMLREQAVKADLGSENAAKTHRVAWFSKTRIDHPDKLNFVCKRQYRLVLLSIAEQRAYTVVDAESSGEISRRKDEAHCPSLKVHPHWSPDGKQFIAFVDDSAGTSLAAGRIDALEQLPYAALVPSQSAAANLTQGAESQAWRALETGDFVNAAAGFTEAGLPAGNALVAAFEGDKKAAKKADKAYSKSKKTARDQMLRAAAYVAAGRAKKATKWIATATEKAASYDEILGLAALFAPVDPHVSNQLAVYALSHPTAEQADTTAGWLLLARGLLVEGEYSKADEALSKLKEPTAESLAIAASIQLDRRQLKLATSFAEDLLFTNPGHCVGYQLQGRLRSAAGDNDDARALFGAAAACDPALGEAVFYAADFARLAGDTAEAKQYFDQYLRVDPKRRSDPIRDLRRDAAQRWSKRFGHDGVVLTDLSCRKGGAGFLCTGTLKNASKAEVSNVDVKVLDRRRSVGSAVIEKIAAGDTAPFGVSFTAKSLKAITVSAGRDKSERAANETPAR